MNNFLRVRNWTEKIVGPLETEDLVIQSMDDVSPLKWHMAHVSWFFETFILKEAVKTYEEFNKEFSYLFNSYYIKVGDRFSRPHRGLLSRPTVKEIYQYRKFINDRMLEFINETSDEILAKYKTVLEIGLNHEQQHQELMLTDIKHIFSLNPLYPIYKKADNLELRKTSAIKFLEFPEGISEIGAKGDSFFYDNEMPRHKVYLHPFAIADRLIINSEYIEFIESGGYENSDLWLSQGISWKEKQNWSAPLYWQKVDNEWFYFTLNGFKKVNPNEPVCHVSKYEADAFAHWKGMRLPTEYEWEIASQQNSIEGNFLESENFHPTPLDLSSKKNSIKQLFGDVWEWTSSDYSAYPGYKIPEGAIGEYNGKFMSEQIVLRGGSCVTSKTHIRNTYRNFFYPKDRWQFMGIRLAKDLR